MHTLKQNGASTPSKLCSYSCHPRSLRGITLMHTIPGRLSGCQVQIVCGNDTSAILTKKCRFQISEEPLSLFRSERQLYRIVYIHSQKKKEVRSSSLQLHLKDLYKSERSPLSRDNHQPPTTDHRPLSRAATVAEQRLLTAVSPYG